jgi:hypothetical protein
MTLGIRRLGFDSTSSWFVLELQNKSRTLYSDMACRPSPEMLASCIILHVAGQTHRPRIIASQCMSINVDWDILPLFQNIRCFGLY